MAFHPGASAFKEDPLDVALPRAGRELGAMAAVNALMAEVKRIWETFDSPSPLTFSEGYWSAEGGDADVQLRSAAIAAFHSGS